MIKRALGWRIDLRDSEEPLPYRAAVWGLVIGLVVLTFLLRRAGMTFWVAATFGLLFLIAPTVMTRLRAEAGVFACYGYAPRAMLGQWLGTRRLGPQNLTSLTVCFFNSEYRPQQMPHQLEGFKISGTSQPFPSKDVCRDSHRHRAGRACLFLDSAPPILRPWGSFGLFGPWALGHGRRWYGWLKDWIYYPTNTDWLGVVFHGGRVLGDDASRLFALKSFLDAFAPVGLLDSRRR